MKLISTVLVTSLALPLTSALAQHKAVAHGATHSATNSSDAHGCVKVGVISTRIPALPAGTCAKALYVLSRVPAIKLDYASPMENMAALRETFPIDSSSITLAYADIQTGKGALAVPGKFFSLLYTGYLADGTEFDSSAKHGGDPIVIQYGKHGVIPGWDTGLDGMRVGGKRRLFIPYELAYGANGQPPTIPGKTELIFDVEFVAQSDTRPVPKPAPAAATIQPQSTTPRTAPPTSMDPTTAPKP